MRRLACAICLISLTACSPALQERFDHAWNKDTQRLQQVDWGNTFMRLTDLNRAFPSYQLAERAADAETCYHPTAQQRRVQQDGISDHVNYTWCAMAPYGDTEGQRLDGRPAIAQ